jgi:DNA-binding SARP family transcriptional activator
MDGDWRTDATAHSVPTQLFQAVFELFPHAIGIADRGGNFVATNQAFRDLAGGGTHGGPALRCCDVVGCGGMDLPLKGHCLTELAFARGACLPELRVDLPSGGSSDAAWVTAAPLGASPEHVVFQLREGAREDRRRRTEPHWIAGAKLEIFTLGRTRVESFEGPIAGDWLDQRPGALLKLLVAGRAARLQIDQIAETLWPQLGVKGIKNVRYYIHVLRHTLEPNLERRAVSSFITSLDGGYLLDRSRVWIDADAFEENVTAGLQARRDGDDAVATARLEEALELYRGDFLAEEPYTERDLMSRALRALTDMKVQRNDLEGAVENLRVLGELEPFDVDVHRELIVVCLRRGRRSEAARRFAMLRSRLTREFGELPGFTLADLAEESGSRALASDLARDPAAGGPPVTDRISSESRSHVA